MKQACNQCGANAMYVVDGHALCLQCTTLVQHLKHSDYQRTVAALNYLRSNMSRRFGLPDVQMSVPDFPFQPTQVRMNNISITNSTIGVVNTGTAQTLNATLNLMATRSLDAVANDIRTLCDLVAQSTELPQETKADTIEGISFVVEQSTLPAASRRSAAAKATALAVAAALACVSNLAQIWSAILDAVAFWN